MFEALKIVVILLVAISALRFFRRNRVSTALKLLFCLLFLRVILAAYHSVTFAPIVGSLSLISVASIMCVGLCFIALPFVKPVHRSSFVVPKVFLPIYLFIGLMLVSTLMNGELGAGVASLIKWIYLLQLITLFVYVLELDGLKQTVKTVLIVYAFPATMLVLSIVMGVSKRNDLDGSVSFVGGYFHEAVYSTLMLTAAFHAVSYVMLYSKRRYLAFAVVGIIGFIAFSFINYRTTTIAYLVMMAALLLMLIQKAKPIPRAFTTVMVLFCALWLSVADVSRLDLGDTRERFADLPNAARNVSSLITYPENYTRDDRRLFSGRLYIWSNYISEANEGEPWQIWFGRGMGAWKPYFEKYAHSTFVSFYFELGLIGLTLFIFILATLFLRLRRLSVNRLQSSSIAFLCGFVVLNMGTMPMWSIEGIYAIAFLFAVSYVYQRRSNPHRAQRINPADFQTLNSQKLGPQVSLQKTKGGHLVRC